MTNAHEEVSNALWMHRGSLVDLKKRAVHHRSVGPEGCVATFGSMRAACGQLKKLQQRIEKTPEYKTISPAGTRTRVFRVRAEYPNQLDYRGWIYVDARTRVFDTKHFTLQPMATLLRPPSLIRARTGCQTVW